MDPRQRRARARAKTRVVPIILVSFLGFFMLAGVAFCIGLASNVSRWLSDLPDYTDASQYLVSEPTTILDANGNTIANFYVQNRESVNKDQVSPYVLNGTVATEDERFYEHGGVDLWGIARAAVVTVTGGHEGASTITQQLVRNTILSDEQFDQTIKRKVREAFIAIKMEEEYSKDDILMMYLNTIYYGHGAYGIQAASRTYLGKNANELSLAEAALLVGLPNAPGQYDPTIHPDLAVQRRNIVLDRMLKNGYITQEEHDAAQKEELKLNVQEMGESGALAYPYFVDYVKSQLQEEFSSDMIFKGGLTVKTTIDPTMQSQAENAALVQIRKLGDSSLDVGMVVVDPKTGYIKAMVGGKNYNDASNSHINHVTSRRPTGSSFKPFTLAAAIVDGMNPSVRVSCPSTLQWSSTVTFQNYGKIGYGTRTLAQATAVSSNTGYVQIAEAIGNDKIIEMCKELGIDTDATVNGNKNFENVPSLTLGTASISPLEMAEAYTAFANGGNHRKATGIAEIDSRDGKVLYSAPTDVDQVFDAGTADAITNVLETVMTGNGTGAKGKPDIDQPVAGKTGTAGTNNSTTNLWFCGYTPQLVSAIWVGHSLDNNGIGSWTNPQTTLPIFKTFMETALADTPREEFQTGTEPAYKSNKEWKFRINVTQYDTGSSSTRSSNATTSTSNSNSSSTSSSSSNAASGSGSGSGGGSNGSGNGGNGGQTDSNGSDSANGTTDSDSEGDTSSTITDSTPQG